MKSNPAQTNPVTGTEILTRSGLYVNPLALRPEDIVPEDIAHATAHACRFSGHVSTFYSVAEHAVRVLRWVEEAGGDLETCQWALIHDASEAYLVDIPRPLKVDPYFGKAYRGAEDRAMRAVCERFGLPPKMPELVKEGDTAVLAAERRDLMPKTPGRPWGILEGVKAPPDKIVPWRSSNARQVWLLQFGRLFKETT